MDSIWLLTADDYEDTIPIAAFSAMGAAQEALKAATEADAGRTYECEEIPLDQPLHPVFRVRIDQALQRVTEQVDWYKKEPSPPKFDVVYWSPFVTPFMAEGRRAETELVIELCAASKAEAGKCAVAWWLSVGSVKWGNNAELLSAWNARPATPKE
jgi:hypothetical protein